MISLTIWTPVILTKDDGCRFPILAIVGQLQHQQCSNFVLSIEFATVNIQTVNIKVCFSTDSNQAVKSAFDSFLEPWRKLFYERRFEIRVHCWAIHHFAVLTQHLEKNVFTSTDDGYSNWTSLWLKNTLLKSSSDVISKQKNGFGSPVQIYFRRRVD